MSTFCLESRKYGKYYFNESVVNFVFDLLAVYRP